jgi:hypothetical protein
VLVLLDKSLQLSPDAFVLGVVLLDALFVLLQFGECLRLLSVRQSHVLLGISNFLGKA